MADDDAAWRRAALLLHEGAALDDACAALPPEQAQWLVGTWPGSQVHLVAPEPGVAALVLRASPGREMLHLVDGGARVRHRPASDAMTAFTDAWLGAAAAAEPPWDLIVIGDGLRWGSAELRALLREALDDAREEVTVVATFDNVLSPLRAVDRIRKPAGSGAVRPGVVRRELAAVGLEVRRRYGLARSTVLPNVAFDLDAPLSAAAVLAASTPLMRGLRGRLTRALRGAARRRWAGPLVAGWTVVATRAESSAADPPYTGRVANLEDEEQSLLLGEPPTAVERWHRDEADADAVVLGLETMAEALPGLAPRLLARPGPRRVRMEWLAGLPLSPFALTAAEVESWVRRAAEVLRDLQAATRRDDGSVLVHGDYWLGNLLAAGDRITGIIDWPDARWGSADVDRRSLVESFAVLGAADGAVLERLRAVVDEVFAAGDGAGGSGTPVP